MNCLSFIAFRLFNCNFFLSQLIISIIHVVTLAFLSKKSLPSEGTTKFSKKVLLRVWKFSGGMTLIAVLSTVLSQIDKIFLSKLLPLEEFGYYTIASVIAINLLRLVYPINTAVYPRLTQLISNSKITLLKTLYHQSCQLLSAIILPVSAVLFFFSREILLKRFELLKS